MISGKVTSKRVTSRRDSTLSQGMAPIPVSALLAPGGAGSPPQAGGSAGASAARASSPLSPTRHSRIAEKVELQNLNDRLACYIDRVRFLESENARLTVEIQTSRDTVTRETTNIKQMYEKELQDARKLLDETSRDKAKLEIDTKRLWEENEDLKESLDKKTKDHAQAEAAARMYESRALDLNGKYHSVCGERKKLQDEARNAADLIEKLRRQQDDLRKLLEKETLVRVEIENQLQSLKEELFFRENLHTQELSETRSRRQVEISEIDGRLADEYEAKLQQSLKELRDQYEAQIRSNREEIETLHDAKLKNLTNAAERSSRTNQSLTEELRTVRSRVDGLNGRIGEMEKHNAVLQARIRELEMDLDGARLRRQEDEAELARLRQEMELQLQEYQDLMDIKTSLDLEIAAYDKLLCGEEQRLNITPLNASSTQATTSAGGRTTPSGRSTPASGLISGRTTPASGLATGRRPPSRASVGPANKRKRVIVEESEERNVSDYSVTASSKGVVEFLDICSAGRYVQLTNKSNQEVNIGGWQLIRNAGDANDTVFKFHRSAKIPGGASVTVWSSDMDHNLHSPPTHLVMKSQKWFAGDNIKTRLLDAAGEEIASSERVCHTLSSRASRHREAVAAAAQQPNREDSPQLQRAERSGSSGSTVGRLLSSIW